MMSDYLRATGVFDEACQKWWMAATPRGSTKEGETTEKAQLLATAARSGEALAILLNELGVKSGVEGLEGGTPPLLPRPLSAKEFTGSMSAQLERDFYQALTPAVVPASAARPALWKALSLWWWEKRYIPPDWITATAGNNMDDDDRLARYIGWRIGGLSHVQGSVSVFAYPIARAWWRPHMADRAAKASDGKLTSDQAHKVLHDPAIWAAVRRVLVKRLAALNSPRALAAALLSFESHPLSTDNNKSKSGNAELRMGWLGRLAPVVDFSTYPMEKLIQMCSTGSIES